MPWQKTIDDVYVVEILNKRGLTRLLNRNYDVLTEVPTTDVVFDSVCLCSRSVDWREKVSDAFWFCLSEKTNKRATAEIWETDGRKQVILQQEGCGRGE